MKNNIFNIALLPLFGFFIWGFSGVSPDHENQSRTIASSSFYSKLADSAYTLTFQRVSYDPSYFKIPYPNGDVPADKGVCTDVVIRAYRKVGIDLQKEVHEDMKANFNVYPKIWGLTKTDRNIDHRRVPNLMKFFSRKGKELAITDQAADYKPGHIVCWNLGGATTHIGIVSNHQNKHKTRYMIVHNIGAGQVLEDCLFTYKIIGHYTYNK
jgi:uncharacterized protein YijF (DUF1287 family)